MEKNVPKLRFNGFNDEWKKSTFKELTKKVGPKNKNNEEFKVYSISNKYGFIPQDEQFENSRLDNLDKSAYKVVRKGDFAYNPARINVGSIGLLEEESGIVSSLYVCFRFAENLNNQFFKEYFSTYKFNKDVLRNVEGGVRDYLFYENFIRLKVNVPSKEEQERIANFLTKVDKIIEKQEEKVKNLENYKKGMMQKIFSQEIRFKDENGEEYPKWEEKKLKDVSDVRDGTHDSPVYVEKGYPLITSKNLCANGKIDYNDVNYITKEDYESINQRSKVNIGDILFGMIGTIGNPVIVDRDGFAIKNVALIKENEKLINKYLIYYLYSNNILKQFYMKNTGGTQKFIALNLIRDLSIEVPALKEQIKIASFLSNVDNIVAKEDEKLEKLKQWKKGLLQQMFI